MTWGGVAATPWLRNGYEDGRTISFSRESGRPENDTRERTERVKPVQGILMHFPLFAVGMVAPPP